MTHRDFLLKGLTGEIIASQWGNAQAEPLICLHGWLDNAASFYPLAQVLPEYKWIAVDFPGHGFSAQRPLGAIYHFTDYVADVFYILQSLAIKRCVLVSHSMGAGVSALFAAVFPEKVKKLVLIDGIGPISYREEDSLQQFRKSMAFLEDEKAIEPRVYDRWSTLVERRLMAGKMKKSSAELLLRRSTTLRGKNIIVHSDPRLKQHTPFYMSENKVLSILQGISAPILLVLAKQGLIKNIDNTANRINAVKNVQVVEVQGHHHVHMDFPKRVAPHIQTFLNQK